MDVQKELKETYYAIRRELKTTYDPRDFAILLNAKANVLTALQKYEKGE